MKSRRYKMFPSLRTDHLPKKVQIACVLTSFLDPGEVYDEGQINAFIENNTKAQTRSNPRLDVDHIRLAMLEHGFLERNPRGTEYRVAADYSSPWDYSRDETKEYRCPFCGFECHGVQFPIHLNKFHEVEEIIERWLGTS